MDHTHQLEPEFSELGSYEPGFIHLRIDTPEDLLKLNGLRTASSQPDWLPTFLHEYVHFLQDVTTTHGLWNFHLAVEFLQNAIRQVRNTAGQFPTPLKLGNDYNLHANFHFKKIYGGTSYSIGPDRTSKSASYLGYYTSDERVGLNNGKTITVPKFHVKYRDNGAKQNVECHFGSIHIKEYMAHAIQEEFAPGAPHPDIPYRLVKLIVESEVPRLAENPSLVIALCDASLMVYHPAQLFFSTLERMKKNEIPVPNEVGSIYAIVLGGLKTDSDAGGHSIASLFDQTTSQAKAGFRDALKAKVFEVNVDWFEALIEAASKFRLNRRGFITQLVSSQGNLAPTFFEAVRSLGIPFTTNSYSKGIFVPPANVSALGANPTYPKVFQALIGTFAGSRGCSMHSFCKANSKEKITNGDCLSQPWERVGLPELCPYAQMWRTWGLEGKTPLLPHGPKS